MCRAGGFIHFLVVATPSADDRVLLGPREAIEPPQVMDPLLNRDKTGTVKPGARPREKCRVQGRFSLGVFRSVFITGQIAPAVMEKRIDHRVQYEAILHGAGHLPAPVQEFSPAVSAQPAP